MFPIRFVGFYFCKTMRLNGRSIFVFAIGCCMKGIEIGINLDLGYPNFLAFFEHGNIETGFLIKIQR